MHDFKYCIWACLEEKHPWYRHNFACRQGLHVTIHTHIDTLDSASTIFNDIINNANTIKIGLDVMNPRISNDQDFNALFFPAYVLSRESRPRWWPRDAHMSFSYAYNCRRLELRELWYIQKTIFKESFGILNNFKLVRCTGHFNKHWLVIREHKLR